MDRYEEAYRQISYFLGEDDSAQNPQISNLKKQNQLLDGQIADLNKQIETIKVKIVAINKKKAQNITQIANLGGSVSTSGSNG